MSVLKILEENKATLIDVCTHHQVHRLYLFGSALSSKFDESKSDVDLLVEIDELDPVLRGELLISFWNAMEAFFGRKVDLLTETSITNTYLRSSIQANKKMIYDREAKEVFA